LVIFSLAVFKSALAVSRSFSAVALSVANWVLSFSNWSNLAFIFFNPSASIPFPPV